MPRSKKQQIASKRNWDKMRILGIITILRIMKKYGSFVSRNHSNGYEKDRLFEAIQQLTLVIANWNANTKELIKETHN